LINEEYKSQERKTMLKAVLVKSPYRFETFHKTLEEFGVDVTNLDFDEQEWMDYDYGDTDFLIHYPIFKHSSNHPLALQEVYDNIMFLSEIWPQMKIYPDPGLIKYYNDKYRQFLFLKHHGFPIPETIPLFSKNSVDEASDRLGFPLVLKNRYGAGGGQVFKVGSRKELLGYYRMSKMDLFNTSAFKHFIHKFLKKRVSYYWLVKGRNSLYPFFSSPLLAQKFMHIEKDLKTVTGYGKMVEAHWRYQADSSMWKMNIDGGGTGVWEYVPEEAIEVSLRLAKALKATWLNIDLMQSHGQFLISEFSPVWHHYGYKEYPSFIYKDNYNIDMPLEKSLDLERIIVESLIEATRKDL
jgi:hypothetical protein